jgi:hypothetical protein
MAIRKDDLEALGDLAGYAGGFLTELQKGTGSRSDAAKLYHINTDPKILIRNALNIPEDIAGRVDVTNIVEKEISHTRKDAIVQANDTYTAAAVPAAVPATAPQTPEQMEFSFVNRIVQNYGTVGDIITHFDERLNKIDENLRYIKSFIIDVRSSMDFIKDNMSIKRTPNTKKK